MCIPKPHKKTMDSITFPKTKEIIHEVFAWDEHLALVQNDSIVIIDIKGNVINEIKFPKEIPPIDKWEEYCPSRVFFKFKNKLFFLDIYKRIMIFKVS